MGRPINRFKIMARTAVAGLAREPARVVQAAASSAAESVSQAGVTATSARVSKQRTSVVWFELSLVAHEVWYWFVDLATRLRYPELYAEAVRKDQEEREMMLAG